MGFFSGIVDAIGGGLKSILGDGLGSIISGGLGLVGGKQTNDNNQEINSANNAFNAGQAELNRNFQANQTEWAANREDAQAEDARDFNSAEAVKAREFNSYEALKAREFNSYEATKNREYLTDMSNTQYQRAIGDLKAAGLNPMMAALNGGAGTPSSGAASGPAASGGAASGPMSSARGASGGAASAASPIAMQDRISPAINSAYRNAQLTETMKQMQLQNNNIKKQNDLIGSQIRETEARADNLNADTNHKGYGAINIQEQTKETIEKIKKLKAETEHEGQKQQLTNAIEYLTRANAEYRNNEIGMQELDKRIKNAEAMIRESGTNKAQNESEAQKTWYMKNIAPFLPDALKATNSAERWTR